MHIKLRDGLLAAGHVECGRSPRTRCTTVGDAQSLLDGALLIYCWQQAVEAGGSLAVLWSVWLCSCRGPRVFGRLGVHIDRRELKLDGASWRHLIPMHCPLRTKNGLYPLREPFIRPVLVWRAIEFGRFVESLDHTRSNAMARLRLVTARLGVVDHARLVQRQRE